MDFQKTPSKENNGSTLLNGESGTGLNQLSPPKDGNYGAAFSLASLDQGNRSGGSLLNLTNFDTGVFLKSGSFDSLHTLLGSQFFKQDADKQVIPPLSSAASIMNNSSSSMNILPNIVPSSNSIKSMLPTSIPSNVISTSVVSQPITPNQLNQLAPSHFQQSPLYGNNALIQPKENDKRIVEKKDDNSKFVDVTPFLTLPQHEAAKKLGIPSSTLAKRWKEASCNRKWPYRTVSKLDKEILTLLKNVESAKAELSPSVEATLGLLLKKRNEELKTVLVRL